MAGLADSTCSRSSWRLIRYAGGLVRASALMRARDLRDPLLRVLDWTLAKPRTEAITAMGAIATAAYFLAAGGLSGLILNLQIVGAAGALIYGPGLWLRNYRRVPPAPPRQRSEQSHPDRHHDP
jgi:hypothetical protein